MLRLEHYRMYQTVLAMYSVCIAKRSKRITQPLQLFTLLDLMYALTLYIIFLCFAEVYSFCKDGDPQRKIINKRRHWRLDSLEKSFRFSSGF